MGDCVKLNFDLSCEMSSHYFKSSFARSVADDSMNQSKSLDYVTLNGTGWSDKGDCGNRNRTQSDKIRCDTIASDGKYAPMNGSIQQNGNVNSQNGFHDEPLPKTRYNEDEDQYSAFSKYINQKQGSGKVMQETHFDSEQGNHANCSDVDIARIRKEFQSLQKENRRMQVALGSQADTAMLQSQVRTLQWQLRQIESSREMYRAVMEQVVRFLERAHSSLDIISTRVDSPCFNNSPSCARVSRCRSVYTVDESRTDSLLEFPRANSDAYMRDSTTFSDYTWRRRKAPSPATEETTPEKLSREAYRLLRTTRSLLGTREPDLARLQSPSDHMSLPGFSPGPPREPDLPRLPTTSQSPSYCTASLGRPRKVRGSLPLRDKPTTEDESGFSSMSSFQEVGLPTHGLQDLGVPITEPTNSWSPVQALQVLWV